MERIGVRELRQHASRYLERVAKGETLEVTDRGRPVARLVPITGDTWSNLVASGRVIEATDPDRVLGHIDQIDIDNTLLDDAATLAPGAALRTLDSIHVASARTIGADLRALVTYDYRMGSAADALGLPVEAPA